MKLNIQNYHPNQENISPNIIPNKQPQQQPAPTNLKQEFQISQATKDRVNACKAYIERKYFKLKQEEQEKKDAWQNLQKRMENLQLSNAEQELIKREILHKETERYRKLRQKITVKDFEPIAIIGRGAFGEVRVCRIKETGEIVAMKKMSKSEMVYKNQIAHVRAERDVLAQSANPWIVELKFSFQDEKTLYLVMEYLAGGDLMTLLMKKDILSEREAKFYIAEAILAVDSVHKLNYIHRDLKPDNILLDAKGHIKLSDFGLCKQFDIRPTRTDTKSTEETSQQYQEDPNLAKKLQPQNYRRNRQLAYSTVGTPDYIAPEVFSHQGYTLAADWWSIGVILYEMLVGYPPFFSEDPSITCQKIIHWRKTLTIPPEAELSPAAADLIKRLLTDQSQRLGVNGVEEIKAHPFFSGVDWKNIRDQKAPNVPEIKSEIDTSNFDKFEEEEPWHSEDAYKKKSRKDANFVGYTFKREIEAQRSHLVTALQELEANNISQTRVTKPQHQQGNLNWSKAIAQKDKGQENVVIASPIPLCKSPMGLKNTTNSTISSNNIASALSVISQMKNSNYPLNNPTTPRTKQINGTPLSEVSNSALQNQGANNNKTKSPNVANTKEKYMQQLFKDTNGRSNTPTNQNVKTGGTNYPKKELNIGPCVFDASPINKPKYTPTNNGLRQPTTKPGVLTNETYTTANTKSSNKLGVNFPGGMRQIGVYRY